MEKSTGSKKGTNHRKHGSTKVLSKTTITNSSKHQTESSKHDHANDKELINSGLFRLGFTFNNSKTSSKNIIVEKRPEQSIVPLPQSQTNATPLESNETVEKELSVDRYTMTDIETKERKLSEEPTVLSKQPYRDLQWSDPRLLKKYFLSSQACRKAVTIPLDRNSQSDVLEESEEEEIEFAKFGKAQLLYKFLYYFCMKSASFVGAMCGFILISMITWRIYNEYDLQLQPKAHYLFFTRLLANIFSGIFYLADAVFKNIVRVMTMSTSEVLAREEEIHPPWYRRWI